MHLSRESKILAGICLLDLASTVWLITSGMAREANPILGFYLDQGLACFIVMKFLLVVAPVYALEMLRVSRPRFIRGLLRAGIVLYLLCYGLGVWQVNQQNSAAQASAITYPLGPLP